MTELYNSQELHALTGYARPTQQAAWLKDHGIPHRVDGRRIIVSRIHVQAWLEGKAIVFSSGPNWSAVK
jgi:hypothetical protein